jgi:hypothetical protein
MISYINLPSPAMGSNRVPYNGEDLITFSNRAIDRPNLGKCGK